MNNNQNMTIGRMHARPLQVTEIGEVAGAIHVTAVQITASSAGGGTIDGNTTFDF